MKPKIVFYLMNKKGLEVLKKVTGQYSAKIIEFVVLSKDSAVKKDYLDELIKLCDDQRIKYFMRDEELPSFDGYKFAVGWRWIIVDCNNLIVLHDSILPKYRGFSPLVNMLINGEKEIGVTALFATQDYDKGPIISQNKILIQYPIKISTAINLISEVYQATICKVIDRIILGKTIEGECQNEAEATYSIWRDESDYLIDWSKNAAFIKRSIDALGFPYGGAKTIIMNEYIIIDEAEVVEDVSLEMRHPGKVIFFENDCPVIICGENLLKITKVRSISGEFSISKMRFRTRFGGV